MPAAVPTTHRADPDAPHPGVSLGAKLAITTVAVLLAVSAVVLGVLTRTAHSTLLADKTHAAALVADLFAASTAAPLDFGDDKDVDHDLQNLRVDDDVSYAAVWREGGAHPIAVLGEPGLSALPPVAGVTAADSRLLPDSIEMTRPIRRPDGSLLGIAVLRFSLAAQEAEIARVQRGILLGTLGTLVFTALLILAFARAQIVRPLARLADAARRVQTGEHAVRVAIASHDEIGRLASAFNTMTAAVIDREEHLADAVGQLRELFDNMRQGIVVFGADGVARAAPSRQAAVIFGPDVAGEPIIELLYRDAPPGGAERQAFEAWLECAFEAPSSAWDEVARLAPEHVERAAPAQWLELAWSPVFKSGVLDRVMLLATDVTRERQLEQAAEVREEQHAREMGIMRRLVAGGGQVFATFLDAAREQLVLTRDAVDHLALTRDWNDLLMRVHTLRGEARTFELRELAAACEAIEQPVRRARDEAAHVDAAWTTRVLAAVSQAESLLEHARGLFIAASPIGVAVFDQMTVRRSDVRELVAYADRVEPGAKNLIKALSSRPFGECVTGLDTAATRWADENDKRVRLAVSGQDARVPGEIASAVTAILPHLVRNAIAHGIETPDQRRVSQKDEVGTIRITAATNPLTIRVTDDGAGLDETAIRRRARDLGIEGDQPTTLAFAEGLSTAPAATELSGYGVGLSAALRTLTDVGCAVEIRSDAGRGVEVLVSLRTGT